MPDETISRLIHDVRSPLTVVEGFAHLLERDDERLDHEQRVEYAQRIKAAAAEIRELLDARRG
jgi:K+-sensing histidine kinase KdpD